jgi:hypothetical protein
MNRSYRALFAGLCIVLVGALPAAAQQSHADFYKSKGLKIMLGHPPGGSYDLYARLAAEFLPRYLPGNPTIIVEHKPGGGGVVATAWFYVQAPRDGSMISLFPETIPHTQILEPEVGRWKVQEMTYIGSFAPVNTAYVVRKDAPAENAGGDEKKRPTSSAATGVTAQSYQLPAMLKNLAGFKFNLVCGYPGGTDNLLALSARRGRSCLRRMEFAARLAQASDRKRRNGPGDPERAAPLAGAEGRAADARARLRRKDQEGPGIRLSRLEQSAARCFAPRQVPAESDRRAARSFRKDGEGQGLPCRRGEARGRDRSHARRRGAEIRAADPRRARRIW